MEVEASKLDTGQPPVGQVSQRFIQTWCKRRAARNEQKKRLTDNEQNLHQQSFKYKLDRHPSHPLAYMASAYLNYSPHQANPDTPMFFGETLSTKPPHQPIEPPTHRPAEIGPNFSTSSKSPSSSCTSTAIAHFKNTT